MPPTRAARWMTTSAPSSACRVAAGSRRSWSDERITLTSAPSSESRLTVGVPRKPAPPVTATDFPLQNWGSGWALDIGPKRTGVVADALVAVAGDLAGQLVFQHRHVGVDHQLHQLGEAHL